MNRLDATEHLRRQMHEMRSLLESALPCLGSPGGQSRTPVTTSSPQQAAIPSAPSDGQHASEVPVNQVFQPEACHAIAGPSVVVNAESGGRGGGMLSAPLAMVSCIDESILNLPGKAGFPNVSLRPCHSMAMCWSGSNRACIAKSARKFPQWQSPSPTVCSRAMTGSLLFLFPAYGDPLHLVLIPLLLIHSTGLPENIN